VSREPHPPVERRRSPLTDDAEYWAKVTAGFDFSEADQVPTAQFNRVLWTGLMGSTPYPALRGQAAGTKDDDDRR
jgi:hypothetical protein